MASIRTRELQLSGQYARTDQETGKRDLSGYPGLGQAPSTIETMAERLFMVYLNGAPDPMDSAYRQPVRASSVEVTEDCVTFLNGDGTLSASLDKAAVSSWREISDSEFLAN